MGFARLFKTKRVGNSLPLNVHNSVVRSLYSNQFTLLVGTASMVFAPIVLYFREYDTIQLAFACLFFIVGAIRLFVLRIFAQHARKKFDRAQLQAWETRYAQLGAVYVGILGLWYLVGFARSDDEFVHMMSLALTLCYLAGISGRNFGSERVVRWQVLTATFPLIAAMVLFGDPFHIVLVVFLLPFFVSIWMMASKLRQMLFKAAITSYENRTIANRFDAALNSISHGIAMFDENGNAVVSNSRFCKLTNWENGSLIGQNHSGIGLQALKQVTNTPDGKLEVGELNMVQWIAQVQETKCEKQVLFENIDGKILEAGFFPMRRGMVLLLEDVSDKMANQKEILWLANFDSLTSLGNRGHFLREVEAEYNRDGEMGPAALFFVDLDKFKDVNDTLGHAVGDQLLVAIAERLKSLTPENATICRFGGDEFVILVRDMTDREECAAFAKSIINELLRPQKVAAHTMTTGASVGIAISPENGMDAKSLLQYADAALYEAKAGGRASFVFYSCELGKHIEDRRQIERDLRQALDDDKLELYFQPLLDVQTKQIVSCEGLLRWNHETKGMIPPSQFIPLAEEIGIISELGEYVLYKAAKACMNWPAHINVAVNISSLHFQKPGFCDLIQKVLDDTGLQASRLELEITESVMLIETYDAGKVMQKLSEMGVLISLDDFGTGFSSLSYLCHLPISKIKIDRSFVRNIVEDERTIIVLSGISRMAKELGLLIVVEGIETRQQLEILEANTTMNQAQGFLFSRALPAKDVLHLILHPEEYGAPSFESSVKPHVERVGKASGENIGKASRESFGKARKSS